MAAFSRLQLAAALLEYDNDLDNPDVPRRSAQDSAIFAPMRRARPRPATRKSTDYLSVALPSDAPGSANRHSVADHRKSQASIDALRNPFGADEHGEGSQEDDHEVEDMEVDLASWGLDAFVPKEKGERTSRKPHGRTKSATLGKATRRDVDFGAQVANIRSRSMSVGNFDSFGLGGAFLDADSEAPAPVPGARPHSIATPLDLVGMAPPERPPHLRRQSDHALIDKLPVAPPLHSVPFPRSTTPAREDEFGVLRPSSRASKLDLQPGSHGRTQSTASMGSQMLLRKDEEPNPFAVRPPSPDRASRFDPKARSSRALSTASRELLGDENNPFALRAPSPGRSSRFDPKAADRVRTTSNASMGSRLMHDAASTASGFARDRQYSKWDLMRPKVLIMPSPLQNVVSARAPPPPPRDGFQLSTDGPPLPPGARTTTRRSSGVLSTIQPSDSLAVPNPSQSFTPNPRMNLSLSQLTFRNTLMVGGQRDAAYSDLDEALPRATEEGQQIEDLVPEPAFAPIPVVVDEPEDLATAVGRPAGKLYGRSLIDNLEARKAEMRSKQRVYRGGDKPSMMTRPAIERSSTFINPADLQSRPVTQHMDSFGTTNSAPALGRRQSTLQPLLNFDGDKNQPGRLSAANPMVPKSRSVFGVDTLWEREMVKLREIEEHERLAAEERKKREDAEEALANKKKGKKWKGKDKAEESPLPVASPSADSPPLVRSTIPTGTPVLPAIQRVIVRGPPPPPADDESGSESEGSVRAGPATRRSAEAEGAAGWGSSSDEGGPRRTTGTGPRIGKPGGRTTKVKPTGDDDSEEDVPLAATIGRALQRNTQLPLPDNDDSDEEKPLASLLDKTKLNISAFDFDHPAADKAPAKPAADDDDDDDEQPLGLRASALFPASASPRGLAEDDDVPLALHPEQQRRSQYHMLAQQQQQMMQAQAMQSMFFSPPSVMGSGFFNPAMAPPMTPMMMMPPPSLPSPPPLHDAVKLNRVDRWRREVSGGVQ